jgi:hypothetical protein
MSRFLQLHLLTAYPPGNCVPNGDGPPFLVDYAGKTLRIEVGGAEVEQGMHMGIGVAETLDDIWSAHVAVPAPRPFRTQHLTVNPITPVTEIGS